MKIIVVLAECEVLFEWKYLYLNGKLRAVSGEQVGDGDFQMRSHPDQLQLLASSASPVRFTSCTLCRGVWQAKRLLHT